MTKPLFSIPTHQFLFSGGNVNPRDYMDALQLEESEYDLIKYPERGTCLFKCGNERYLLQVIAPEYKAKLFGNAAEDNRISDNGKNKQNHCEYILDFLPIMWYNIYG